MRTCAQDLFCRSVLLGHEADHTDGVLHALRHRILCADMLFWVKTKPSAAKAIGAERPHVDVDFHAAIDVLPSRNAQLLQPLACPDDLFLNVPLVGEHRVFAGKVLLEPVRKAEDRSR